MREGGNPSGVTVIHAVNDAACSDLLQEKGRAGLASPVVLAS